MKIIPNFVKLNFTTVAATVASENMAIPFVNPLRHLSQKRTTFISRQTKRLRKLSRKSRKFNRLRGV